MVQGHPCITLCSLPQKSDGALTVHATSPIAPGLGSSGYLHPLAVSTPFLGWSTGTPSTLGGECGSAKGPERSNFWQYGQASGEIHLVWKKNLLSLLNSLFKTPEVQVSIPLEQQGTPLFGGPVLFLASVALVLLRQVLVCPIGFILNLPLGARE